MSGETGDRKKALAAFAALAWPLYLNDFYLIPLSGRKDSVGLLWTLDVVFYTLVPVVTFVFLYRKGWFGFLKPALAKPEKLWLAIGGAAALAVVTHVVFTRILDPVLIASGCCKMCRGYPLPAHPVAALIVVFYAPLSAGIIEEVIFRGVLTDALKKFTAKPLLLVALNAALFAAIHWCGGSGKLLTTFLIGLVPAAIYLRTGNLWLPVLWHVLHDAIVFARGMG